MQGPPPPPAPPGPPPAPTAVTVYRAQGDGSIASASAVYEALKAQRRELGNQLENLQDRRDELSEELQDPMVSGVNQKGIEQRITELDGRISLLDKQIAESEQRIAEAAGVPGAVVERPPPRREGPPEEVFVLGGIFIVVVLFPLSIAYARRLWKRGAAAGASLPAELGERLTRLEQGMDAVAVEVERIGEGQRYMTRMFAEDGSLRAIGAGAAEPVPVKAREADAQYRR